MESSDASLLPASSPPPLLNKVRMNGGHVDPEKTHPKAT